MSLSTTLEYVANEQASMTLDESLDYLIQLRDEIEKRIKRACDVRTVCRYESAANGSEK